MFDGSEPVGTPGRLDSREVIARVEYLESIETDYVDGLSTESLGDREGAELLMLYRFRDECESFPDWPYGLTLVRDSDFTEYARDYAHDLDLLSGRETWPHNCIDWEAAAEELQMDYTSVELDGVTYWTHA